MAKFEVRSEIVGTVWKMEAKVGDELKREDIIAVLESMKMEIPLQTPQAGRIVELYVNERDQVVEDQVIALLENI